MNFREQAGGLKAKERFHFALRGVWIDLAGLMKPQTIRLAGVEFYRVNSFPSAAKPESNAGSMPLRHRAVY